MDRLNTNHRHASLIFLVQSTTYLIFLLERLVMTKIKINDLTPQLTITTEKPTEFRNYALSSFS